MDFVSVAMSDCMDFMSVRCSEWRRLLLACIDWNPDRCVDFMSVYRDVIVLKSAFTDWIWASKDSNLALIALNMSMTSRSPPAEGGGVGEG